MQNPLLAQRKSALDTSAAHGMSAYEYTLAEARMEQALMLGNLALRFAKRARAGLRSATIVLFGAPATAKRA